MIARKKEDEEEPSWLFWRWVFPWRISTAGDRREFTGACVSSLIGGKKRGEGKGGRGGKERRGGRGGGGEGRGEGGGETLAFDLLAGFFLDLLLKISATSSCESIERNRAVEKIAESHHARKAVRLSGGGLHRGLQGWLQWLGFWRKKSHRTTTGFGGRFTFVLLPVSYFFPFKSYSSFMMRSLLARRIPHDKKTVIPAAVQLHRLPVA